MVDVRILLHRAAAVEAAVLLHLLQRAEPPQVEGNAGKKRDVRAAALFVEEGNVPAPQGLQLPERHLPDDPRDAAGEAAPAPVAGRSGHSPLPLQ